LFSQVDFFIQAARLAYTCMRKRFLIFLCPFSQKDVCILQFRYAKTVQSVKNVKSLKIWVKVLEIPSYLWYII